MNDMVENNRNYIEKYYSSLHLEGNGITENSALQDVVAACVDKAFEVSVKGRAGEDYGIYKYSVEIMHAKEIAGRGIMQFLTAESVRLDWFSALLEEIVGSCFAGYNLERANAETGRKAGFTHGNAQCLISISLRNIMAYFTVCGINKYDERFKRCHKKSPKRRTTVNYCEILYRTNTTRNKRVSRNISSTSIKKRIKNITKAKDNSIK